ncbi:hypothetical protein Droror1_Dr00020798 [Drosera rotundifolia]
MKRIETGKRELGAEIGCGSSCGGSSTASTPSEKFWGISEVDLREKGALKSEETVEPRREFVEEKEIECTGRFETWKTWLGVFGYMMQRRRSLPNLMLCNSSNYSNQCSRAPCAGFRSVIDGLNGFMRDQFVGSRGAKVAIWLSEFDLSCSVGRRLERLEVLSGACSVRVGTLSNSKG